MSASSAAKVFTDIWNKWGEYGIQAGCGTLAIATANPAAYAECVATAAKYEEKVKKMIAFWNDKAANGWATIGPRQLETGENLDGTLIGTGGRMFISPAPVDFDQAKFVLSERDGKGHASLTVSRVTPDGKVKELFTSEFNDDKSAKKDEGEKVSKVLTGLKGHLLYVHLDGKSVTNKFGYRLRVDPQ